VKEQDQAKIYKGYGIDAADGEGNNKKSFNFAAVGDFGCSKNAKKTVDNIKDSKPELVLPLGDLSYQKMLIVGLISCHHLKISLW
jgi:hypothetical protein